MQVPTDLPPRWRTSGRGLVDLTADDRAALLGAFLGLADMLKGDGGGRVWWRSGGGAAGRFLRPNSEAGP